MSFGQTVTVPATGSHTATVIMCHGLGDTGNGWAPVATQMSIPYVKWIFPTAPTIPVTVNMGMTMPAWFDLDRLDATAFTRMLAGGQGFDPAGTGRSMEHIKTIIAQEIKTGIPASRIVLGGFSQGGHIALKTAVQHESCLAGCAALSTWMEPSRSLVIPEGNKAMPVMQGHGADDPLIPSMIGQGTAEIVRNLGFSNVDFKLYPGVAHSTNAQEMQDLRSFLVKCLPDAPPTADEVRAMSVGKLKKFLRSRGVSTSGMLEKSEFRQAALKLL